MADRLIPFGLNSAGQIVDITQVESGHKCNCTCLGCGAPLSARKGAKMTWYFAHASGADCANGYESALHMAVKKIIEEHKALLLPACIVELADALGYTNTLPNGMIYRYVDADPRRTIPEDTFDLYHPNMGIGRTPAKMVQFDSVELEQTDGAMRPDIICTVGGKKLFVEVAVTHFVDDDKHQKIRARNVSTLEIDFSRHHKTRWTWEALEEIVLRSEDDKIWLHNVYAQTLADRDREARIARVAPILHAKQKETDDYLKERLRKAKYYEENYAAIYDIKIRGNGQLTYHLELCGRHARVTAWELTSHKLPAACQHVATRFKGTLNEKYQHWEFKPSKELLFELAGFLLQPRSARITYFKCPPEADFKAIPAKLRDRLAIEHHGA